MTRRGERKEVGLDPEKQSLREEIERLAGILEEVSLFIHAHPEEGLREELARRKLVEVLAAQGFTVGPGPERLPTAFVARYSQGGGRPRIAFLAEYDALPGVGHACGHNLIAAVAVGAATAVRRGLERFGRPGTVLVFGTPAEEGAVDDAGGKVYFVEAGFFDGVDAALMAHPSSRNAALGELSTGRVALEITFLGKAAHAAGAPHEGINALDAAILTFNAWNALRQHLREEARIHGIIAEGGVAPNIIPDRARIRMYVRARDPDYLEEVERRVRDCALGAARATGARVEFRYTARTYQSVMPNRTLARVYTDNLAALGVNLDPSEPGGGGGSTDAGNVSRVVPLIHPYFAICPRGTPGHSPEFARAAATREAHRAALTTAQALAMTAWDLLRDPRLLREARAELEGAQGARNGGSPGSQP
ncbi:MAG: M20 family metallopeptidase [Bacillota bacterium]|nr:M20 family metallopeptidase [Bacillota bacterium]